MKRHIKTVQIVCEQCNQVIERPKGRRFCNRTCANKWLHANGKMNCNGIKNMNMSLSSLIERYGEELGHQKYNDFINKMKLATTGEKNPMYGKNYHTHGLIEANKKRRGKTEIEFFGLEKAKEISKKKSLASTGCNNSMFGKPSPALSGKGVKGYYKNHYFRSLLELLCMKHLEEEGINLEDVDYENFVIPYTSYDGHEKTYRPDFFIKDKNLLIEVKPIKLTQSPLNLVKFEAARKFCKEKNLEFRILTEESFTLSKDDAVKDPNVILLELKNEKR